MLFSKTHTYLFAAIFILAPSFALPGAFGPDIFDLGKMCAIQAATLILFLSFFDSLLHGRRSLLRGPAYWNVAAAFCLYLFVRGAVSNAPQIGLMEATRIGSIFLLGWLAYQTIDIKQIDAVLFFVLIGGAAASAVAILQSFNIYFGYTFHLYQRVSGFFGDPNSLCGYLIFPFWSGIYLLRGKRSLPASAAIALMLLSILATTVLTFSRSGWLGLGFSIAVFCILYLAALKKNVKKIVFLLLTLLLVAALTAGVTKKINPQLNYAARAMSITSFVGDEGQSRLYMWYAAAQIGMEHPLIGSGPGTYFFNQVTAQKKLLEQGKIKYTYTRIFNTYNDYLQIFSDTGLIGISLFLATLALLFGTLIRALFRNKQNRILLIFLIPALSSVVLEHTAFQFPFYNSMLMACFALFSGIALRQATEPHEKTFTPGIALRATILSMTAAAVLVAIVYCVKPIIGAQDYQRGFSKYRNRDFATATYYFEKSVKLYPTNFLGHYYLGISHLYMNEIDEARQAFLDAVKYFPTNHLAWNYLAQTDKMKGDKTGYIEHMRRSEQCRTQ